MQISRHFESGLSHCVSTHDDESFTHTSKLTFEKVVSWQKKQSFSKLLQKKQVLVAGGMKMGCEKWLGTLIILLFYEKEI